jgi:c(7)-type cytochrome triheme protein
MRVGARKAAVRTGLLAAALVAAACTTQNPVMTFLFDGVPRPGEARASPPVVKQPRRAKYAKPPPAVTYVEVPDIPPPTDWKAIRDNLPKLEGGEPDWVKALELKLIAPKPGIAADAKDEDPTDLDVEIAASGQAEWVSVFSHKSHTAWIKCDACHANGLFEMEKGKVKMTMAGMGEGQWCGACHGKVAMPEISGCPSCHPKAPK